MFSLLMSAVMLSCSDGNDIEPEAKIDKNSVNVSKAETGPTNYIVVFKENQQLSGKLKSVPLAEGKAFIELI